MSAGYLNAEVQPDRVEFDIKNESGETWRAADGFAIGYQVFDADTATLIVDGPRVHPERDVKPGESTHVGLDLEVPSGDGAYYTIVSPMREHVCWYWERGWPFLLVERGGARVTTNAPLRRERLVRGIGRALVYPLRTIWRNRSLIRTMVRRDVLGRYRGSFGGSFWTVFSPLLLMLTYFFVFGMVLETKIPGDPTRTGFAMYFLAGMLPWLAFSEAVGRSAGVMWEHRNFVKKLVFAVETLPVNLVVAGLVTECVAVVLFCIFLLATGRSIPATVGWLPMLIVPQVLLTAGLSWFLAALGVFVRDLGQILGFLLTILFFATPICYPENQLPAAAAWILTKSPIYLLVRGYRDVLLYGQAPAFGSLWKLWLLGAVVFVVGHAWFYKLRKSFADLM
jgi:lipopolysaccharide transport system permease protein